MTRTVWTFVVTSLALVMVTLDNLVVTTALPVIRKDLGAGIEGLEWTVNAYTLTFAVLLLTGAALGDRFGRRRMFAIGLGIFTAASAAAALAPSIEALVAARAAQGVGGAIIAPLTLTLLSAAVPAEKRGLALGAWGGIGGLAVALGPLVGGAVVSGLSWQWIFWINVPLGLVLIPLAWRRLDESHGPSNKLDLPGVALASLGLLGIVWGLVRGNGQGWSSPEIVTSLVAGTGPRDRVRLLGVAHEDADAADALLPQPHVRGHERRVAAHVLRDVRLDLPARPVLPDRAGLLAVPGRPADPPVDGDADLRRPDRGRALRPDRRAAADGPRASRCRRSASAGWPRSGRRPHRTPTSSCRSSSPGSGWGSSSRRSRTSCSRRSGRRRRARLPAPTTRSASSGASSALPCWPRSSRPTAATSPARRSSTGSSRRSGSARAVVALGAVAALMIPRRRRRQPAEVEVLRPALDEAA